MSGPKKKLYLQTFGCQMNVADSEQIAQLLSSEYELTTRPEEADLYIINTCAIRRKSEEKVRSLLGRLKGLKRRHPEMILGVGGCVAQQEGEKLLAQAPHLDLVFGTHGLARLPELVRQAAWRPQVDVAFSEGLASGVRSWKPGAAQAYITIMQGCDNYCTYCVVPYVRGPERSRPPAEVVAEVQDFLAAGGKEVTLLGQNVNSYGRGLKESITFPQLLKQLGRLPGLARLRFATSHPKDLSDELIDLFGKLAPLCEHLHLPVQSGSDRILAAMNRGYTRDQYLELVGKLRRICPDLCLSTDLIVGFPGESEADFEATLSLVKEVGFSQSYCFKFSPRPRTRAAELPEQLPEEVKRVRLNRLLTLQNRLTREANQRLVGQVQEVLVEGTSKKDVTQLSGRLRTNQVVNFSGPPELVGQLVWVELTEAHPHSLKGRWVAEAAA
jgi:tRNA-2-methylthio-N6-dimethylallyladenosine synthase|uniref:tRNA-2-methylthio-N(6)-dimethylallyladenosine synthase n=1 Tax=Desulfobacca acetoxidans TaxID=60893 RepID=A0A7C5EL89_9BACT